MSGRPIVVVVEDDKDMNELQCELLQIHGMEAVSAYTGSEAMAITEQRQADAILLDIMLPEMDGFECCRLLRRQDNRHVPIVMITALDTEDSRREGFEAGTDAYFTKPFDPYEVIETLRMLIDRARSTVGSAGDDQAGHEGNHA